MTLYAASVPVFRHYVSQIAAMSVRGQASLDARIGDSFPAGQQFATAAGFVLRVCCPLTGRTVPELPAPLGLRLMAVQAVLASLTPADFVGAAERQFTHQAGQAQLTQTGADFLHLYGLPNFFFHLTMGYAALRVAGVGLGKADFDGLHAYPPGFRFG